MIWLKFGLGVYVFAACFLCVALWLTDATLRLREIALVAFSWPWHVCSELYEKFKWRIRQYKKHEPQRPTKRDPPRYELN